VRTPFCKKYKTGTGIRSEVNETPRPEFGSGQLRNFCWGLGNEVGDAVDGANSLACVAGWHRDGTYYFLVSIPSTVQESKTQITNKIQIGSSNVPSLRAVFDLDFGFVICLGFVFWYLGECGCLAIQA
jgi:hypothetical protein